MRKNTGLAPIVWVIIAAVLLGGGYSIMKKSKSKMENAEPVAEQTTKPTVQKTVQSHITIPSDWKTYRNEEYGFEFQYPENTFALVQTTKLLPPDYKSSYIGVKLISATKVNTLGKRECFYGGSGLMSMCVADKERGIDFIQVDKSILDLTSSLENTLQAKVTVAWKPSIKWSIGAEGDGIDYYFIPLDSRTTVVVSRQYIDEGLPSGFPAQKLFEQVLSTFRFTPLQAPTE